MKGAAPLPRWAGRVLILGPSGPCPAAVPSPSSRAILGAQAEATPGAASPPEGSALSPPCGAFSSPPLPAGVVGSPPPHLDASLPLLPPPSSFPKVSLLSPLRSTFKKTKRPTHSARPAPPRARPPVATFKFTAGSSIPTPAEGTGATAAGAPGLAARETNWPGPALPAAAAPIPAGLAST